MPVGCDLDTAGPLRLARVEIPQPVEMGEFGAHAAEIVPDAAQDRFDLGGGFFRKGGRELCAARSGFPAAAARSCASAGRRNSPCGRDRSAQKLEQAHRQRADHGVAGALLPARRRRRIVRLNGIRHQKCTITLPNTCRLSIRARPCSKSASGEFGIDDRRHAGGDLRQAVADVAHARRRTSRKSCTAAGTAASG